MCAAPLLCSKAIRPNLELKTRPKQLLVSLTLDIVLFALGQVGEVKICLLSFFSIFIMRICVTSVTTIKVRSFYSVEKVFYEVKQSKNDNFIVTIFYWSNDKHSDVTYDINLNRLFQQIYVFLAK
jgi:hypothetical protein